MHIPAVIIEQVYSSVDSIYRQRSRSTIRDEVLAHRKWNCNKPLIITT